MFKQALQKIVDHVDGGLAGLVMGFDGIPIEMYVREEKTLDLNTIGMEFSFILTQVKKAAETVELGAVQEVTIKAEKLTLVIRVLTGEYFLALALSPEGNFGKGRYLMRIAAPKLQAEL